MPHLDLHCHMFIMLETELHLVWTLQIAPLIVITIIFWRACKPVFAKPMSVLSLRTAVDMDHNDT